MKATLIKDYLKPSNYGLVEFLFVSLPIFAAYMHLDYLLLVIVFVMSSVKIKGHYYRGTHALNLMVTYAIAHEILLCLFVDEIPSFHISNLIFRIFALSAIYIISPVLDLNKIVRCYVLLSIIVIIGLIYHFLLVKSGNSVTPIKIPFLPYNPDSRLEEVGMRPVSFFMEPSNLCNFLILPLFISLYFKKIVATSILVVSILISTSTNGLIAAGIMVLTYLITQHLSIKNKLLIGLLFFLGVSFFMFSSITETSREKAESTDVELTSRLINGPSLVVGMPSEHLIFGFPAVSVEYYKDKTNYISDVYLLEKYDMYFISSFWLMLAKFGIVSIILFFMAYYSLYKNCHHLIILMAPLFILKFSVGGAFEYGTFINTTFMIVIILYEKKKRDKSSSTEYQDQQNGKTVFSHEKVLHDE